MLVVPAVVLVSVGAGGKKSAAMITVRVEVEVLPAWSVATLGCHIRA